MKDISMQELKNTATQMRMKVIDMIYKAQSGHPGGSLSAADFVTACYFKYMNLDPKNPRWEDRDRMVFSRAMSAPSSMPAWLPWASSPSPCWTPCARRAPCFRVTPP